MPAATPREYRVEMFEAFALFNAGDHQAGCAKAMAAFDGLRESLNNEIGALEDDLARLRSTPDAGDAALPPHEQAFYLGAVWGHRQGREHDGPLNGAAIHDEYRRYFPANSQATQWSEAVARADEARAAQPAKEDG